MERHKINFIELIMFIYTFSISFFPIGAMPLKLIKVVFCLLTIFFIIKSKRLSINKSKYIVLILSFTAFSFLSILWATNSSYALSMSITLLLNSICTIFMFYLILENNKERNISIYESMIPILYAIILGSICLGMRVFIVNGPLIFIKNTVRGVGNISANILGMNCAMSSIFLILLDHKKSKMSHKILLCITIILTLLSASRKSIIYFGFPILFTTIFTSKDVAKALFRLFFSCIIVLICFLCLMKIDFLYEGVGHRVESMIAAYNGTGGDGSAKTRNMMIDMGIKWFEKKPVKGYGMNNYSYLFGLNVNSVWGKKGVYAHNNFVELMVDVGIIGVSLYYLTHLIIIIEWIKKWKSKNYYNTMLIGVIIAIIIADYGMVSYFNILTQLIILMCWLIMNQDIKIKTKDKEREIINEF